MVDFKTCSVVGWLSCPHAHHLQCCGETLYVNFAAFVCIWAVEEALWVKFHARKSFYFKRRIYKWSKWSQILNSELFFKMSLQSSVKKMFTISHALTVLEVLTLCEREFKSSTPPCFQIKTEANLLGERMRVNSLSFRSSLYCIEYLVRQLFISAVLWAPLPAEPRSSRMWVGCQQ